MSKAYAKGRARAKSASAQLSGQSCGEKHTIVRSISPIILKFQDKFPVKTALELALRTGASVSTCEKVLEGKRVLGGEFLEALLASDFGGIAVDVIARNSVAQWAAGYIRQRELSELRREHVEHAARIRRLEEAGGV